MNTYAKGEKIKYPTITEDMLESIEDENSSYMYKLSKSQFDLTKCIGCPYIYFIDMLLPTTYVDEDIFTGNIIQHVFSETIWTTANTQVTIKSIDEEYYGIEVTGSVLQSPFAHGEQGDNSISAKVALIESVKEQPEVEISEEAKTNFKTNMGSFADWNAREGEAGYIKNKLFRFIAPNGEYEFKNALKETDFTPIQNEYGNVYLYKKQIDADGLQYVVANKKAAPYGSVYDCAFYPCEYKNGKYIFETGEYTYYFWVETDEDYNNWLYVESSQSDMFFSNDTVYIIHNYEETVDIEQIPEQCIPNTIVRKNGIKTVNGQSIVGSGNITIGGAYSEVNHGTADTTFTLTPNTFHVWGEVASLTLDFGSETNGVVNEYLFQFTSGATATSLTLPDDIKWANNKIPTIVENMIYQVSILKGLASILEFSNTSDTVE